MLRRHLLIGRRGFSLLEFAVTLPVILSVVAGTIAVGRVLQARNALEQSLQTGLRCLSPTDARCATVNGAPPTALFNWYRNTSPPVYRVDEFDYSGQARWFEYPEYFHEPQATILGTGYQRYSQTAGSAKRWSYNVPASLSYYRRTARFPYINTAGGTRDALNPSFDYRRQENATYSKSTFSNGLELRSTGTPDSGSLTFRINSPWSTPPAYIFVAEGGADTRDGPFTTDSQQNHTAWADSADVVIHIRGDSHGASGAVTARLEWAGGSMPLGGRRFGGPGFGNFVPRGARPEYVEPEIRNSQYGSYQYNEFDIYTPINIPYNTDITITFTLSLSSGDAVEWDLSGVDIYTPKFEQVTDSQDCAQVPLSVYQQGGAGAACSSCLIPVDGLFLPPSACSVDTSYNADTSPPIDLGCSLTDAEAEATLSNLTGADRPNYIRTVGNSCSPYEISQTCPDFGQALSGASQPNYGISDHPNGQGEIRNSLSAAAICAVTPDSRVQAQGVAPYDYFWSERTIRVPESIGSTNPLSYSLTKSFCNTELLHPAILAPIPASKLSNAPVNTIYHVRATGDEDPYVMQATSPELYNCPLVIPIRTKDFDETEEYRETLFFGDHSDVGDCWESILDREAREAGLSSAIYFHAERDETGFNELPAHPQGECPIDFDITYPDRTATELLTLTGPLPHPEKPAICSEPEVICFAELASFQGGEAPERVENYNLAETWALRELQTAMPDIRHCDGGAGANCVDFQFQESIDASGATVYLASGTIEVPLLFGQTTAISLSAREAGEDSFTR